MARTLAIRKLYSLVGERIRETRKRHPQRFTQVTLSSRSTAADKQIPRSSLANIERGHQNITLHQLYRIADLLDVEPATLLPARQEVFDVEQEMPTEPGKRQWADEVLSPKVAKPSKKARS